MQFYYSPNTKGFYLKKFHGDNMPEDVRPIDKQALGPKPSSFHTIHPVKDEWELTPEGQGMKDESDTEQLRVDGIKTERELSGLKKVTIEQAHDFIDNKLDSASSASEVKEALRDILKKMIPHLLD